MSAAPLVCPLCGPTPSRIWRRHAGHTIVRCRSCGLLATWPRPSEAELRAFYDREDYYAAHDMGAAAAAGWSARAQGLLTLLPARVTSVLDFGAGEGHAVAAWRAMGLDAEGVEPSAAARESARRRYGIELSADVAAWANARFDLVTAIHSLEHVAQPLATLSLLAGFARTGGHVLVEVPHARTVALWTRRGRARVLHLPAHLYHFAPETLARLVERAGLTVVDVRLSNPDALERVFAWRAARRRVESTPHAGSGAAAPPPDGPSHDPSRRTGWRGAWAGRALPWIRQHFPGYKFQLLARRPG